MWWQTWMRSERGTDLRQLVWSSDIVTLDGCWDGMGSVMCSVREREREKVKGNEKSALHQGRKANVRR